MKTEERKPQIAQMNADVSPNAFICAHLRHLRFNHVPVRETDKALREMLKRIGV